MSMNTKTKNFIKVHHNSNGNAAFINIRAIASFQPFNQKNSKLYLRGDPIPFELLESVEEILEMLDEGI